MSSKKVKSNFLTTKWTEAPVPFADKAPIKTMLGTEETTFKGDEWEGVAHGEYVMSMTTDPAKWHFAGHLIFNGSLAGKKGAMVMDAKGTYDNGKVAGTWVILTETATGELKGAKGTGSYVVEKTGSGEQTQCEMNVEF